MIKPAHAAPWGLLWGLGLSVYGLSAQAQSIDTHLSRLINQGQFAQAQELLLQSNPSKADRLFFEARLLKRQGRNKEAVAKLRATLQAQPNHINAKRELAHTLLLLKEFDVAEFHFKQLLEVDRNEAMRDGYQRFLNVISSNKPYGLSGSFAFLPSTNINRGTQNRVFDTSLGQFVIDPNSRAESGVGAQVGLSAFARHQINKTDRLLLSVAVSGNLYKNRNYNALTGSVSLSYQRFTKDWTLSLGPTLRKSWKVNQAGNYATGFKLNARKRLNNQWSILFSSLYEYRTYPDKSYNDGGYVSGTLALTKQIDPSLALSAGIGMEHHQPESRHARYTGFKAFAQATKNWKGGTFTSLRAETGKRDYEGAFPLFNDQRADRYYSLSGTIGNSKINYASFTPRLTCSYSHTSSNIAFHDYDAAECNVGVTREF